VGLRDLLYGAYERRLAAELKAQSLPRHVGVMLDGNRRWAKANGANTAQGHQAGADNISPLLGWCEDVGVEVVTLWLLSTDNLNRPANELEPLLSIIENVVGDLAESRRWRLNPVGALDLLPGVADVRLTAGWYGMRPMTPDGMPLAGPAGPLGLWVHGGHGSIGMMTAPAIAGWLAKAIVDGIEVPELAEFRMGRF